MAPRIYTCAEWGAAAPKRRIELAAGRPDKIVFHHTAGHVAPPVSPGGELAAAFAYARAIQRAHMAPGGLGAPQGGNDSGHDFLVTRAGHVLEGRHGAIAAARVGRCVLSAHCPGQNDQPGIEHEHIGGEDLTPRQRAASIELMAWLCRQAPTIRPTSIFGHRDFFATSCPSPRLYAKLPELRADVARALNTSPKPRPRPARKTPAWYAAWVTWKLAGGAGPRPRSAPRVVPAWAWDGLVRLLLGGGGWS